MSERIRRSRPGLASESLHADSGGQDGSKERAGHFVVSRGDANSTDVPSSTLVRRSAARLLLLTIGVCIGLTLAAPAGAFGLVSKTEAPRIVRERAILTYDRGLGTETLTVELTFEGQADDSMLLVVPTPARPSFYAAKAGAFDIVEALVSEIEKKAVSKATAKEVGGSALEPKVVQLLPSKDPSAILAWAKKQKLDIPPGLRGWLGSNGAGGYVAFVRVPTESGKIITRFGFKSEFAFYPYSSPTPAKVDLELIVLGETPVTWFSGTPKKKGGTKNRLSLDYELSGAAANTRLGDAVRKELGLDSPVSTLWLGRYTTNQVARSHAPNAWFEVSTRRRADDNVKLLGPPFGSASAKPAASVPLKSKAKLGSGAAAEKGPKVRGRRKRKPWPTSAKAGFVFFVVIVVGGVMWYLKRREAA